MLSVIPSIQDLISAGLKDVYALEVAPADIFVESPENEMWGDYSSNIAMVLAKSLKQSPLDIAKNLSYRVEELSYSCIDPEFQVAFFEVVAFAQPGFINFKLSQAWLLRLLKRVIVNKDAYGSCNFGNNKHVALEHSNVNPNKAPHIGHLRNAVIGDFIKNIYEFLGYNVNVQYYSNDVGVQVATSYLGSKVLNEIKRSEYPRVDYYAWDIYSDISEQLLTNNDLKLRLGEILEVLEDPNNQVSKDVALFADEILVAQLRTFTGLDITYDIVIHERDIVYLKMWEETFEILKKNPNVYFATEGKSKGCWLIKTKPDSLADETSVPTDSDHEVDKIIVRANGVPTYTGKDIAYHMWKFGLLSKDFNYKLFPETVQLSELWETSSESVKLPESHNITYSKADIVIDVIDQKQTYAINTVKESLKFLGFKAQSDNMFHINYGFVYLSPATAEFLGLKIDATKDQYTMSGRKGVGIKILDFTHLIDEKVAKEFGEFAASIAIRNGAIKFEFLKYNTFNDIVFDLATALNIKGFSGPYVQYTHARASTLISKAGIDLSEDLYDLSLSDLGILQLSDALILETTILRHLALFDEVVKRSAEEFAPSILCEYLFKLSKLFNNFYNDVPVLTSQPLQLRDFRLFITYGVKIVLHNGLSILGIKATEKV